MSNFAISTDTNCEFSKELRERFGLDVLVRGHVITPDGIDHLSDTDWELYPNPEAFYAELSDKKNTFSTSPANETELAEYFRPLMKEGKDVLFIALSSGLSGTYNFALNAKKTLEEEFPGRRLEVIDSLRYGLGLGLLTASCCELRKEGKSFDEVVAWANENRHRIHEMGPMDDLFFLSRKGRISKGKAFMGTLVGIKPMGDFNQQGLTTVLGKAKGVKGAIQATIEYVKRTIEKPEEQIVFVTHTNRAENARLIKEGLEKEIHPKEIILLPAGPSSGTNIGPGLAACFYYGKPISKDNVEETAIMNEALKA